MISKKFFIQYLSRHVFLFARLRPCRRLPVGEPQSGFFAFLDPFLTLAEKVAEVSGRVSLWQRRRIRIPAAGIVLFVPAASRSRSRWSLPE